MKGLHKQIYKVKITKEEGINLAKKKGEGKRHIHEFSLGVDTLLFIRVRNPLLFSRLIIRILKNVLGPFRGQVRI